MAPAGFETAISAGQRLQTYTLDRADRQNLRATLCNLLLFHYN